MRIALLAHDNKKNLMENLCIAYRGVLTKHELFTTGTTGQTVEAAMGARVHKHISGYLGGEQQICALIIHNDIDAVIFLRDPYERKPNEPDINSVLKLCDIYNIPLASNLATAEALLKTIDKGELNWQNAEPR